jgi:hypothetical protein
MANTIGQELENLEILMTSLVLSAINLGTILA